MLLADAMGRACARLARERAWGSSYSDCWQLRTTRATNRRMTSKHEQFALMLGPRMARLLI